MKLIRRLVKIVVILLVVMFLLLGVAWWQIDSIAKTAIESGGTYALGVQTTTDHVGIGIFTGRMHVDGLNIANPPDYHADHLMRFDTIDIELRTASIFSDVIEVPSIVLDGLSLNLEKRGGKTNIAVINENLQKHQDPGDETEPAPHPQGEADPGPTLHIGQVVVRNIEASVQLLEVGGDLSTVTVTVPEIVLNDLTPDNARGIAIAELTRRLIPAIMVAVLEKGAGVIPADLRQMLTGDVVALANNLGGGALGMVERFGGNLAKDLLNNVTGNLGQSVDKIGEKLGDTLNRAVDSATGDGNGKGGLDKLGENLGNLLDGQKKNE